MLVFSFFVSENILLLFFIKKKQFNLDIKENNRTKIVYTNVIQFPASIISTTDVITSVVGAVGIGAILTGGVPPTPVQPGAVPQGLPQPGTSKYSSLIIKVSGN